MGVDLYGNNGKQLHNNWWWWRPLAEYCFEVAPEVCEASHHFRRWTTNDGYMTAREARQLCEILQAQLDSGATKRYQQARQARLEAMPDEPCELCHGTGVRTFTDHWTQLLMGGGQLAKPRRIECNRCDGYKSHRPAETSYSFNVENVQEFVEFLKTCGGFEVH